jgi:hypothetical protein
VVYSLLVDNLYIVLFVKDPSLIDERLGVLIIFGVEVPYSGNTGIFLLPVEPAIPNLKKKIA